MPTGKDTCGGGEGGGGDAVISLVSGGKENRSPRHRQRAGESRLLTVTVGSKPSDAAAWLPGVDAVVSLLRTLARVVSGRALCLLYVVVVFFTIGLLFGVGGAERF